MWASKARSEKADGKSTRPQGSHRKLANIQAERQNRRPTTPEPGGGGGGGGGGRERGSQIERTGEGACGERKAPTIGYRQPSILLLDLKLEGHVSIRAVWVHGVFWFVVMRRRRFRFDVRIFRGWWGCGHDVLRLATCRERARTSLRRSGPTPWRRGPRPSGWRFSPSPSARHDPSPPPPRATLLDRLASSPPGRSGQG